jgi:hypothetical protein
MDAMYLGLMVLLGVVLAGLVIGCEHLMLRDQRGRGTTGTSGGNAKGARQ